MGYCDFWRDFVYIWSQDIEFYCYVDIANRVIFLPSRNGYAPIFTFYLNGAELSPSHSENEISQDLGSTHQSSIPLLIDARADGWWMSCKAEQLHTMLYIYKFDHGTVMSPLLCWILSLWRYIPWSVMCCCYVSESLNLFRPLHLLMFCS